MWYIHLAVMCIGCVYVHCSHVSCIGLHVCGCVALSLSVCYDRCRYYHRRLRSERFPRLSLGC